jgi:hypothetical protein
MGLSSKMLSGLKNVESDMSMYALYWSHIKMMRECPQKFLWSRGDSEIDLGAGFGKPKPLPETLERQSEHYTLMGSVLSRVVELVYNDELWREPQNLKDKVTEIAEKEFLLQEQGKYLDWRFMPREEAIATCVTGAVNFLKIMKHNRLLGDYARSEVRMDPWLNQVEKDLKICGIADLIYRDRDGKVHILDGKNASTPGKYEDDDQLRWYALCYRLVYGVNPDGLAFFYFRYPPNTPPEKFTGDWTGMIKVDFNDDDLKRLAKEGLETQKAIKNKNYEPNPMPKHCVNCPFEDICEPRQEQKKINSAKRNKNKEHIEISKEPVNVSNSLKILNFGDK